jgi:hypothetical protein
MYQVRVAMPYSAEKRRAALGTQECGSASTTPARTAMSGIWT